MAEVHDAFPPRRWYRKVPFISTTPRREPIGSSAQESPEASANWFSLLTFQWLSRIIATGYTRPLQSDELFDLPANRKVSQYADRLERAWLAQKQAAKNQPRKRNWYGKKVDRTPSLTFALNEVCFQWFWIGGMMKLVGDLAIITSPLLLRSIIDILDDPSEYAQKKAFGLAAGLFLLLVLSVTANVHGFYRSYTTGILLRGALMHVIYRRATTKLSERSKLKHDLGKGKLMSLMSADVSRIDFCCGFFHSAWTSITQILVCLALVIYTIGYSALPGFGLIALLYPVQNYMVRKLFQLRRLSMPFTDARIKAVVEAVAAVRLIKTYAFELPLLARIKKLRLKEIRFLRHRLLLRALNLAISFSAPTLAAVVSFICFGATNDLSREAGKIFSALTFFLLLRTPLQMLPVALSSIADASAAIERLASFMEASDQDRAVIDLSSQRQEDPSEDSSDKENSSDKEKYSVPLSTAIEVQDAKFAHYDDDLSEDSKMQRLNIDTFTAEKDELVCIIGPVGAGKSTFLRAMMGDMDVLHGSATLASRFAYAPQTAWLLSETIRENITFGRPYDETRYEQVLQTCCLGPDLARLSDGDMTVVGELGVSLSGGQKQRISLARAIYGQDPILFLDDCFSALDAEIGAKVFDSLNRSRTRQKGLTIVLVTHSLPLLSKADKVAYMDKGQIEQQGSLTSLLADTSSSAAQFIGQWKAEEEENNNEGEDQENAEEAQTNKKAEPKVRKEVMQKEERAVGSVSAKTYLHYILMGRAWLTVPVFLISIVVFQSTSILSPLWLKWWQTNEWDNISLGAYMGGYTAFGIGQSLGLFCMSAAFALFCFFCSNHLHHTALRSMLMAPISFFDTTPQGRITHRFSKDVDAVDNVIGETLRLFISTTVQAMGSVILVAIFLPYFLAIAAVVVMAYIWTGMYYRPASRELRRLNNLLRSRIYEHFSESLSGLVTLKVFGAVPGFVQENATRIDSENRAYWLSIACQRWLNLRLDIFGACLVLGSALLVVGLREEIGASNGGVVLSYIVTVQSMFGNMIRQSAEIENNMNSIERLLHYTFHLEQEQPHQIEEVDAPLVKQGWPTQGKIEWRHFTASHRPSLPPSLIDINLLIHAGERVGIVGRTGAGKTTLLSALLRIMEASQGQIMIDDQDIRHIGLQLLRSSISVISQDAVLFAGSLRYNLDPFEQHDDAHLWQCLKQASAHDLNLDFAVSENGSNLSQGQRSQISIARALVKRSKIVVLDEATASIDSKTDGIIQEALHTAFQGCTVLTVAHRLNTVLQTSDRILVMEDGRVAEFDTVPTLYARPNGKLRALCEAANLQL